jgi:ribosomal protein S18 acetylase RimI-like enzyme
VIGMEGNSRRADPSDLEAVLALDRASPLGRERAALLTSRVQAGEVILFEKEDQLLGFAVVRKRSFFGRDFVELLTVTESSRRRGVGSNLLEEVVKRSSSVRIFTSTNQSNSEMIGLLEKTSWQFSGQLQGIDEGDPELIFFKDSL